MFVCKKGRWKSEKRPVLTRPMYGLFKKEDRRGMREDVILFLSLFLGKKMLKKILSASLVVLNMLTQSAGAVELRPILKPYFC